jgi:hypothetical protein
MFFLFNQIMRRLQSVVTPHPPTTVSHPPTTLSPYPSRKREAPVRTVQSVHANSQGDVTERFIFSISESRTALPFDRTTTSTMDTKSTKERINKNRKDVTEGELKTDSVMENENSADVQLDCLVWARVLISLVALGESPR